MEARRVPSQNASMRRICFLVLAAGPMLMGASITSSSDATTLMNSMLGSGITVTSAPVYTGGNGQAGTFTNGSGDIGLSSGMVLSSGFVSMISGSNNTNPTETLSGGGEMDNLSGMLLTPGDSSLDTLAAGPTYDAASLAFNFQFGDGSVGGDLNMNFVFASEEYINWVFSEYNDVMGIFVDGVNIATVGGNPVMVNTINPVNNSSLYINNVANTNGYSVAGLDIKFDGLTTVLSAQALGLSAGTHSLKIAVADVGDNVLDSAVFVNMVGTLPPDPVPEPATLSLVGLGLIALGSWRRFKK